MRRAKLRSVRRKLFVVNPPSGEDYAIPTKVTVGKAKKPGLFERVQGYQYPPYTIISAFSGGVESSSPYQGIQTISTFGLTSDLITGFNAVRDVYHNANVMEGNMPGTGTTGTQVSNFKIWLKKVEHYTTFLNSSNATTNIEVMMVTPTRMLPNVNDVWANPGTWWQRSNDHAGLTATTNVTNVADYPTTTYSYTHLGDRPYKPSTKYEFYRYWRIVSKHRRILKPGNSWKHSFVKNDPVLLNHEDMTQNAQLPGLTYYMIIIINGQVVNGSTVGVNDVSISDAQVAWTRSLKYHFSYATAARRLVWRTTSALQPIATANQRVINDEGVIQSYTEL